MHAPRGRELVGTYPYSALENLVSQNQYSWGAAAHTMLNGVVQQVEALVSGLTEDVSSRFPTIKGQIRFKIETFCQSLQRYIQARPEAILEMEAKSPFTLDSAGYTRAKHTS